MCPPDSERQIEIVIRGEHVFGTVRLTGSSRMEVRLDSPFSGLTSSRVISFFSRVPAGEPGYLGQYGERLALSDLERLYRQQLENERGFHRPASNLEPFGHIRYLDEEPGLRSSDTTLRGEAALNSEVRVQMEDGGRYAYVRFFDVRTNQPFLGEASVSDDNVQQYMNAVKADLNFQKYIQQVRTDRLPKMIEVTKLLRDFNLTLHQAAFLKNFGRTWRAGRLTLGSAEVEQLIERGYLTRDAERSSTEKANTEVALQRSQAALHQLEAAGKRKNAAECRARIRRLQSRLQIKQLMITESGKKVALAFPYLRNACDAD